VTKHEAYFLAVAAISMVVTGTTWLFGPWALVGCGLLLLIGVGLLNVKE
jgi:hypothetical protein